MSGGLTFEAEAAPNPAWKARSDCASAIEVVRSRDWQNGGVRSVVRGVLNRSKQYFTLRAKI